MLLTGSYLTYCTMFCYFSLVFSSYRVNFFYSWCWTEFDLWDFVLILIGGGLDQSYTLI